jgi:hypothetical protein
MSNDPYDSSNTSNQYQGEEYGDYAMLMATTTGLGGIEDGADDYNVEDRNGGGSPPDGESNSGATGTASSSPTTLGDRASPGGERSVHGSVQASEKGGGGGGGEDDEEAEDDGSKEEEEAVAAFRGDVEAELARSCETIQSCLQGLAGELVNYYHASLQVKTMYDRIMEAERAESERLDKLEPQVLRLNMLVQNSAAPSAAGAHPAPSGSGFAGSGNGNGGATGGRNPFQSVARVTKKSKHQEK